MTNTWSGEPPDWLPLALGYYEWRDDYGLVSVPPDAWSHKCCSYVSTATDLARFSAALLNGNLLPSGALRALRPAFLLGGQGRDAGVGEIGSARAGGDAELALFVHQRFAIVTLANCAGFPAMTVLDRVFAAYYPAAAATSAPNSAGDPNPAVTARLSRLLATKIGSKESPAMDFLSSSESAGSREYRYLFDASGGTKSAFFVLKADGKIDGFWIH